MVRNNKNYEQKVWEMNEINNQFLEKNWTECQNLY